MKLSNFLLLFLLVSNLTAQDESVKVVAENINPYPVVSDQPQTKKGALFMSNFNKDVSVGNLHLYSFIGKADPDYYFMGKPIESGFEDMFSEDLRELRKFKKAEFYAVQTIRGEARQYYIIRSFGGKRNNRLALYELSGDQLKFKIELASAEKKRGKMMQVDSWIRDIDGDTLLDIVQVKSVKSKRENEKTITLYRQNEIGLFVKDDDIKVDTATLSLEKL